MGEECWNSVSVYGPDPAIARFRRMCINLPAGPDPRNLSPGWDGPKVEIGYRWIVPVRTGPVRRRGTIVYAWNYRGETTAPGEWHCAFDTGPWFPEEVFEELAAIFPTLAFDCECIESMDDFMGFGWFNPPPGGEAFRQDMPVPEDYWTGGSGFKRTAAAHARHMALVETLVQAARDASA